MKTLNFVTAGAMMKRWCWSWWWWRDETSCMGKLHLFIYVVRSVRLFMKIFFWFLVYVFFHSPVFVLLRNWSSIYTNIKIQNMKNRWRVVEEMTSHIHLRLANCSFQFFFSLRFWRCCVVTRLWNFFLNIINLLYFFLILESWVQLFNTPSVEMIERQMKN
jgi:hypothetical protein